MRKWRNCNNLREFLRREKFAPKISKEQRGKLMKFNREKWSTIIDKYSNAVSKSGRNLTESLI